MKRIARRSGLLLPPTSFAAPGGVGTFGAPARRFVDFLARAGQSLWQMLPLGPTSYGNSPYTATSAFAGNPLLIDLESLVEKGWLTTSPTQDAPQDNESVDFDAVIAHREPLLRQAFAGFLKSATTTEHAALEAFCTAEAFWLEDFALFEVLSITHNRALWSQWPAPARDRHPEALDTLRKAQADELAYVRFVQWVFFTQWTELRAYANERHVEMVGDIPIFVALNSADVWSHRDLFWLDAQGEPTVVAGVPPDYFSELGQRWGNPLYRWDVMEDNGYAWWIQRFEMSARLFDSVRIDHFRGFAAYWEIPASCPTAVDGSWKPGPGRKLFDAVQQALGDFPVIAEDLGDITPDVEALRDDLELPGMKILQFAFGGDAGNTHLPHQHLFRSAVYTGTHDNDTTVGWYWGAPQHVRDHLWRYAKLSGDDVGWGMIGLAWSSCADLALVPIQDVLGLGSDARMNVPGEAKGNWSWRLWSGQLQDQHADRLRELTELYGRLCPR